MNKTLYDWFYIIKNGSVDNTYKMAWCKAIVECCVEYESNSTIPFDRISQKMFKYYWNQTIFFDLQQSPNPNKPPVFITYVREKINEYQRSHDFQPVKFERIDDKVELNVKFLNNQLKKDVSHRFLKVGKEEIPLYDLDKKKEIIRLSHPKY